MSTIIKNGTVVTADLSYKADVRVENGKITEIGPNLKGDRELDASGCYVMPGGIDPHTHLEMPFMGTYSTDDFESGTRAALAGGTTMVVDFVLPAPGQGLIDGLQMWHNKSGRANCDYSFHMAVTWWGEKVFEDMKTVVQENGITTFKHFMAYKGALMVNDDELYASFRRCAELGAIALVHAENGDVVARIAHAEKWLADHPRDGALLLALGRLCRQKQLWGKAQSYLEASLAVEPTPEAHLELASLLETELEKSGVAERHYRSAAMLYQSQSRGGRKSV